MQSTGELWRKTTMPNTWVEIGAGGGGGLTTYDTVILASAASGSDDDLCFVVESSTIYRYEADAGGYTANGTSILLTGDGGNTRWLGVAGQYPISSSGLAILNLPLQGGIPLPLPGYTRNYAYKSGGNDADTKLLLHCNNGEGSTLFDDDSASNHTVTANGDAKQTELNKMFGLSVARFDGDGDYLSVPDSGVFNFGSNDWCIDCRLFLNAIGEDYIIYAQGTDSDNYFKFMVNASGELRIIYKNAGSYEVDFVGGTIPVATWKHVAARRNGDNWAVYIDGVLQNSITYAGAITDFTNDVEIGSDFSSADIISSFLYGYWKMNEAAGPVVADSSGKGRDGNTINNPIFVPGKLNNAIQLNGSNQYVAMGAIAGFEWDQPFSGEAWVYKTSAAQDGGIMSKFNSSPWQGWDWIFRASGEIQFGIFGSNSIYRIKRTVLSLSINTWYHVVFTYDGSGTSAGIHIYVNNVDQPCTIFEAGVWGSMLTAINTFIGIRSGTIYQFAGLIDNVAIYTEELSSGQVAAQWNGGAGQEINPAISYLNGDMDEIRVSNGVPRFTGGVEYIPPYPYGVVAPQWVLPDGTVIGLESFGSAEATFEKAEYLESDNGFENKQDSVLSFDDGTRTFTIEPSVDSFAYITGGVRYTKATAIDVVITDVEGLHYIYFEDDILKETATYSEELFSLYCIVAIVCWDATNSKQILLGDERHGYIMSYESHQYLHKTRGAVLFGGGELTDINADASGTLDSSIQLGNAATDLADEDNLFSHVLRDSLDNIIVYYRQGVDASGIWRADESASFPVLTTGSGRAAWNELTGGSWQLTEAGNNRYLLAHIITLNDNVRKYGVIMGQAEYQTKKDAQEAALQEVNDLVLGGLPTLECQFLGTIIVQTADSYSNTVKSIIISTLEGGDYLDLRGEIDTRAGFSVPASPVSSAILPGILPYQIPIWSSSYWVPSDIEVRGDGVDFNSFFGKNSGINRSSGIGNAFVGYGAGYGLLTGDYNVGIGMATLDNNQGGDENVAVGPYALYGGFACNFSQCIGIGSSALRLMTTGANNIGIGTNVFYNTTVSSGCIGIGNNAGYNCDGSDNLAIGRDALYGVAGASPYNNIAIGPNALNGIGNASNNLAIGSGTLLTLTTGGYNIAFGTAAGRYATGSYNCFIGYQAGYGVSGLSVQSYNIAIGYQAMQDFTASGLNVAIGYRAMWQIQGGLGFNTAIGTSALEGTTGGAYNTAIGGNAMKSAGPAAYNNVCIGYGAGINIDGAGNLAIGSGTLQGSGGAMPVKNNTCFGSGTLQLAVTCEYNVAAGYIAGNLMTAGNQNVIMGASAASTTSYIHKSVAIGYAALYKYNGEGGVAIGFFAGFRTLGTQNTFIGHESGSRLVDGTGGSNTALGYQTGYNLSSGASNVFVGRVTGYGINTGSRNVFIGEATGYSANVSDCVCIGNYAGFNNTTNERLFIANGSTDAEVLIYGEFDNRKIGIHTVTPFSSLDVQGGTYSFGASSSTNDTALNGRRSDGWAPWSIYQSHEGSYGATMYFQLHPNDGILATWPVSKMWLTSTGELTVTNKVTIQTGGLLVSAGGGQISGGLDVYNGDFEVNGAYNILNISGGLILGDWQGSIVAGSIGRRVWTRTGETVLQIYDGVNWSLLELKYLDDIINCKAKGDVNIAIGSGAHSSLTEPPTVPWGFNNVAIGLDAGNTITTGSGNVNIGKNSQVTASTQPNGVAVGVDTLCHQNGVALGNGAQLGSGYGQSVAIGYIARGYDSGDVGIGWDAQASGPYAIAIGQGTRATGASIAIGQNMVATAGQCAIRYIYGNTTSNPADVLVNSSHILKRSTASSIRYKENIQDLSGVLDTSILYQLRVRAYTYKQWYISPEEFGRQQFGLIADEVAEILPDIVVYKDFAELDEREQANCPKNLVGNKRIPENVNEKLLIPVMLAEIQNLKKEIDELRGLIVK